jgi:hypothetical protein
LRHIGLYETHSAKAKTTYSLFADFFAASVSNLVLLAVGIGPVMYSLDHPDPLTQTLIFCKVRGYVFQICLMFSRWFVAFACIDRYALSSSSVRLRTFANARIAYRAIITTIVFWSIVSTHRLIFYEIKGNICGIVTNTGAAIYQTLYVTIGGGIFPATIMIICALLIRRNLVNKRQRRQLQSIAVYSTEQQRQQESMDKQVLNLLFIQIVCYIVFTTPQLVELTYNTVSSTIPNVSADQLAIDKIIACLAELMLYVFPVTSFYLYTFSSRTFRSELVEILRLIHIAYKERSKSRIAPVIHTTAIDCRIKNPQTTL